MKPKFATTYIVIGDGWNIEAFFNYKFSCYIDVELWIFHHPKEVNILLNYVNVANSWY